MAAGWTTEARVARAPGDVEKSLPQLLHKSVWVHVCVREQRCGKPFWCGERHPTAAEAEEHAAYLNMGQARTA